MPYGQIKVDEITFTNAGVDQTISVSGVVASISGNITATGTISGNVIRGGTLVSGATVTGTAGQFGTITGNTAGFTTVTGTTVTGTTANFVTVSGTTVTGATAQFTTLTGNTAGFTTITGTTVTGTTANFVTVSGTTVTGNVGQFTTVTGGTAGFTTVTGTTITGTTLTVASGTFSGNSTAAAFIPTGSTVPTNGVYLPAANTVGVATNGTGRLFVDASGNIGVGTASPGAPLEIYAATNAELRLNTSADGYLQIGQFTNGAFIGPSSSDSVDGVLRLGTGGTERLRIRSDGTFEIKGAGTAGTSPGFSVNPSTPANSFVIDSSGRLGVGTSSPVYLVDAQGGRALFTDNSSTFSVGVRNRASLAPNGNFWIGATNAVSPDMVFSNNAGNERMRITDAGLVGIGTSSPGWLLSVRQDSSSGTAGAYPVVQINNPNATGFAGLYLNDSAAQAGLETRRDTAHLGFYAGGNERARFSSSGQLGIGTTAFPASTPIQVKAVGAGAGGYAIVSANDENAGGIILNSSSDNSVRIEADPGNLRSSSYINLSVDGTERARIDSSGRLLVGTSSTRRVGIDGTLQIEKAVGGFDSPGISVTNNDNSGWTSYLNFAKTRSGINGAFGAVLNGDTLGEIGFSGSSSSSLVGGAGISALVDGTNISATSMPTRLVFSTTADGAASPTERMKIGSDGKINVNSASNVGAIMNLKSFSGTSYIFEFTHHSNNASVGSVVTSTTATSYNTSSDYRLKENVTPVPDGITRLLQLKPSRFNFIADPDRTVDGFLAHEAQAVVPECVTGEKDAVDDDGNPVYQGIDQSKLVPLLTAALQEAIAKIETLEARLTALESA